MRTGVILVALMALCGPALAGDLSGVRCEDKQVRDYIGKALKSMQLGRDTPTQSVGLTFDRVLSATTRSTSPKKVICKVTVEYSYRGTSQQISGLFTMLLQGKDSIRAEFDPAY